MSKWIDVKDGLPRVDARVLVWHEGDEKTHEIGWRITDGINPYWCVPGADDFHSLSVVAWQPLPSPPARDADWIHVGERLPDSGTYALVANWGIVCEAKWTTTLGWMVGGSPIFPTHWQPLPAPPAAGT